MSPALDLQTWGPGLRDSGGAAEYPPAVAPGRSALPAAPRPAHPDVVLRPARLADVPQVGALVGRFAAEGLMLPKTLEHLSRHFREFVVAADAEGRVLGCAALRVYTPQLAEVTSLAVEAAAHGRGVGGRLVRALEAEALAHGIGTLFALTLRPRFFERLGYRVVPKELFPPKVWADCRGCPRLHACDETALVSELR